MLPKMPLDRSTFRTLRELQYLYVDKTKYAYDLITGGHRYFLSRPRRFGKSLFVSTLQEILMGEKDLFEGLWIAQSDYQWQPYGVIKLDFSKIDTDTIEKLNKSLCNALSRVAHDYELITTVDQTSPAIALEDVSRALHKKFKRVAILIDEYDSPIVHLLKDPEKAQQARDSMRHFFSVIKSLDEYINFAFITGVSAFTRAGLFSGINNLQIITLANRFSGICGYTDHEVHQYFDDHIQAWAANKKIPADELRAQIKDWYNGYQFGENVPTVYNPFSLMNALATQSFKNFWIKSGTPTFLIEQLKEYYSQHGNLIVDFEGLEVSDDILQSFDIGEIPLPALLFQAGYITLSKYDEESDLFSLEYPNREVETAVKGYLLEIFTNLKTSAVRHISNQLRSALNNGNIDEMVAALLQLFSHVPYQIHLKDEKFYHALVQTACTAAGVKAQSEYSTSRGRADIQIETPKILYVIELKLNQPAELALQQIKERRYYEPFLQRGKIVMLLGLSFTREPKSFDITYAAETINPKVY